MVIIANPVSGSYNEDKLKECHRILNDKYGGNITIRLTREKGDAAKIARSCNAKIIIAAGGDGLINEVCGTCSKLGITLGVLPFGTRNVFCIEHNIPLDPIQAAHNFNIDNVISVPVGFLNEHPFLLMCGFGFDAEVVKAVTEKGYKKNKVFAHLKEGFISLFKRYDKMSIYMKAGKSIEVECYHIIASLIKSYAGGYTLSNKIAKDKINMFIRQKNSPASLFYTGLRILLNRGFPQSEPLTATIVKVNGSSIAQLDGEFLDTKTTQNYITVKPNSLKVIRGM